MCYNGRSPGQFFGELFITVFSGQGHFKTDRFFLGIGMLSAAASLGMILLWDVDGGLTQIDKYLYSSEDYIKVGLGTTH